MNKRELPPPPDTDGLMSLTRAEPGVGVDAEADGRPPSATRRWRCASPSDTLAIFDSLRIGENGFHGPERIGVSTILCAPSI